MKRLRLAVMIVAASLVLVAGRRDAAAADATAPNPAAAERPRLVLLLADYSHPHKDLAAATLAWMCKAAGVEFDLYYAANRGSGALGVSKVWTVAAEGTSEANWRDAGLEPQIAEVADEKAALRIAQRWIGQAAAVDLMEPIVASYLLPFLVREDRLVLPAGGRSAPVPEFLALVEGKDQKAAYGRWFGDQGIIPLAARPIAFEVTEPCRHILTVFSRHPVELPQPKDSCFSLEPSDEQLAQWADAGKIVASWVLHSGELSHDDSVLSFLDWAALTNVKFGSGVHGQRYTFDPDVVEPLHVPASEGGVLGLVEPVLHSAGPRTCAGSSIATRAGYTLTIWTN